MNRVLPAFAALLCLASASAARAAESYDNCTGFIDSLPATIGKQGVWCLRKNLSTALASGAAVAIEANNVTVDCNDFKLGGLAAGTGTLAMGVEALDRLNLVVRRCNIRGFRDGVHFIGPAGGGHVVEDNRLEGNTFTGIHVEGDGSVVRRNLVLDTGGASVGLADATGIWAVGDADVLDNTISGLFPAAYSEGGYGWSGGIYTDGNSAGSLNGNRIRGLVNVGAAGAYGIYNAGSGRISLRDNDLAANLSGDGSTSFGLWCQDNRGAAKDNIINGFAVGITSCGDAGGNAVK